MRRININVGLSTDTAAIMATIGEKMGSTDVSRMTWGRVIAAAGLSQLLYTRPLSQLLYTRPRDNESLEQELVRLISVAVPHEGDPHPQRAILTPERDGLITPGGVTIRFTMTNILIDFGRDSKMLAASILAALAEATSQPKLFAMAGAVASESGPDEVHLMI